MKNNLLKYFIAAIYLCSTFIMYAQGDENDTGNLEDDEVAAPIDGYVWVLAIIGLIYVFLRIRAFAREVRTQQ